MKFSDNGLLFQLKLTYLFLGRDKVLVLNLFKTLFGEAANWRRKRLLFGNGLFLVFRQSVCLFYLSLQDLHFSFLLFWIIFFEKDLFQSSWIWGLVWGRFIVIIKDHNSIVSRNTFLWIDYNLLSFNSIFKLLSIGRSEHHSFFVWIWVLDFIHNVLRNDPFMSPLVRKNNLRIVIVLLQNLVDPHIDNRLIDSILFCSALRTAPVSSTLMTGYHCAHADNTYVGTVFASDRHLDSIFWKGTNQRYLLFRNAQLTTWQSLQKLDWLILFLSAFFDDSI